MQTFTKIIYTFNKFYGMFLREIKNVDDDIKRRVRENYKVIVKSSPEYLETYWSHFSKYDGKIEDTNESLKDIEVFKAIPLKDILDKVGNANSTMVWNYVYILSIMSMLFYSTPKEDSHKEDDVDVIEEDEDDDADKGKDDEELEPSELSEHSLLFDKVLRIISNQLRGGEVNEIESITDVDMKNLLVKIKKVENKEQDATSFETNDEQSGGAVEDNIFNMFSGLQNSKIADLAKEISSEIDTSDLKLESPQDIMKLMDFSGGNNVLSNIIGKVSSKIQTKISSGEMKHEDLLGEAMNMMSMMSKGGIGNDLFNNPMISQMMKGMKSGKVAPRTDVMKREYTKERLRKKLEEKQKHK